MEWPEHEGWPVVAQSRPLAASGVVADEEVVFYFYVFVLVCFTTMHTKFWSFSSYGFLFYFIVFFIFILQSKIFYFILFF
jgi:hypothetical protein